MKLFLSTGVVEVRDNKCTILTEDIIKKDDYKISDKNLESDKQKSLMVKKLFYS